MFKREKNQHKEGRGTKKLISYLTEVYVHCLGRCGLKYKIAASLPWSPNILIAG